MNSLDYMNWADVDWANTFGSRTSIQTPERGSLHALLLDGRLGAADLDLIGVVSGSPYQQAISSVRRRREGEAVTFDCIAALTAERADPADPDAIKVEIEGHHVGYLGREDAIRYHAIVEAAERMDAQITCNARIAAHDPVAAATPSAVVFLRLPALDIVAEELAVYSRQTFGT